MPWTRGLIDPKSRLQAGMRPTTGLAQASMTTAIGLAQASMTTAIGLAQASMTTAIGLAQATIYFSPRARGHRPSRLDGRVPWRL